MNMDDNKKTYRWTPSIVAVLIVLIGTCLNILFLVPTPARLNFGNDLAPAKGNFGFAKWREKSDVDEARPNELLAIVSGKIVGTFQFESPSYDVLVSAGINDRSQRPWISAYHEDGTYNIDVFNAPQGKMDDEPIRTFRDTDADGFADRKMEWSQPKAYDTPLPPKWIPVESKDP